MVGCSFGWSVCHNYPKGWKVTLPCSYRSTRYQPCSQYFLRIFEHWSKIYYLKATYNLNLSWLFSVKLIVDMNCRLIIVPILFVFVHFVRCLLEILLLYESFNQWILFTHRICGFHEQLFSLWVLPFSKHRSIKKCSLIWWWHL